VLRCEQCEANGQTSPVLVSHACVDGHTELLRYCSNSQHQVIQAQAVKDGSILVGANGLPVLVTAAVYSVHSTTLLRLTPTLCISANHLISSARRNWEPAILSPLGLVAPWVRCCSIWNFATQGAQPLLCGDGIHLLATIGNHSWKHRVGLSGLSSDVVQRQRALQLNTFGSTEAAQSLSQEWLRQGVQGQALMLPPNQIWLDPSTGLGQWLFLLIVVSVQQGFRATQTAKSCVCNNGIKVVRRPTLGNSQSDTRQAGLDALAPATADTTLLLRAVVAHEEVPASSAGLENVVADPSVVVGGVVIIYGDETLDSAKGPKGPDSTGVAVRCVRCLLITESPKTPSHYRYQI